MRIQHKSKRHKKIIEKGRKEECRECEDFGERRKKRIEIEKR